MVETRGPTATPSVQPTVQSKRSAAQTNTSGQVESGAPSTASRSNETQAAPLTGFRSVKDITDTNGRRLSSPLVGKLLTFDISGTFELPWHYMASRSSSMEVLLGDDDDCSNGNGKSANKDSEQQVGKLLNE